jgi:hypothetical protein
MANVLSDENLVPYHVDLIHPQHPPAEPPPCRAGNFPRCGVDQFQAAEWITFTPPRSGGRERRCATGAGKTGQ